MKLSLVSFIGNALRAEATETELILHFPEHSILIMLALLPHLR